jgi:hypothetical protein
LHATIHNDLNLVVPLSARDEFVSANTTEMKEWVANSESISRDMAVPGLRSHIEVNSRDDNRF